MGPHSLEHLLQQLQAELQIWTSSSTSSNPCIVVSNNNLETITVTATVNYGINEGDSSVSIDTNIHLRCNEPVTSNSGLVEVPEVKFYAENLPPGISLVDDPVYYDVPPSHKIRLSGYISEIDSTQPGYPYNYTIIAYIDPNRVCDSVALLKSSPIYAIIV